MKAVVLQENAVSRSLNFKDNAPEPQMSRATVVIRLTGKSARRAGRRIASCSSGLRCEWPCRGRAINVKHFKPGDQVLTFFEPGISRTGARGQFVSDPSAGRR